MLEIDFNDATLPSAGTLVLLVAEDGERPALYARADAATGGALSRAVEAAEFGFGRGKSCVVLGPGAGLARIVLVGLGKSADLDAPALEAAGGAAYQAAKSGAVASLAVGALPAALVAHAALGAVLSSYRFDLYRTRQKPDDRPKLARLSVLSPEPAAVREAWPALHAIAHGTFVARDLVSEPANTLTPPVFADRIAAADLARARDRGLRARADGGAGLRRPARRRHGLATRRRAWRSMQWRGLPGDGPDAAPIAFVGKGVTFDSGGISHQAGRRHGGHEVGHGRRRRGRRPDGRAGRPQGEGQRGRRLSAWSRTCRRAAPAAGRRGDRAVRPDHRGDQHRRRGPARAGRRALVRAGTVVNAL